MVTPNAIHSATASKANIFQYLMRYIVREIGIGPLIARVHGFSVCDVS